MPWSPKLIIENRQKNLDFCCCCMKPVKWKSCYSKTAEGSKIYHHEFNAWTMFGWQFRARIAHFTLSTAYHSYIWFAVYFLAACPFLPAQPLNPFWLQFLFSWRFFCCSPCASPIQCPRIEIGERNELFHKLNRYRSKKYASIKIDSILCVSHTNHSNRTLDVQQKRKKWKFMKSSKKISLFWLHLFENRAMDLRM